MHINKGLVRPQTSPCLMLEEKYTGWRRSCIEYWWVWLDRMTAQSETGDPSQNEMGREAAVALVVWFSILTLSLNKTGLALGPSVGLKRAGGKGRKEERHRGRKIEMFSKDLPILFTRAQERKTDRHGGKWRKRKKRKMEEGWISTGNLIMHGKAAGAKERKSSGWRGKEESTHQRRGMRRQVKSRGSRKGKGDKIWESGGRTRGWRWFCHA